MNENDPIQYMLADLQGRYNKLSSDFSKLKDYQQQIELLKERVNNDISAQEILCRLDAAFPNGLTQEKAKMTACISQMTMQFKQLETQFKNINSGENL
ncbi:chromosome partitioning protein ParA [Yersinia sp. Marseille-Q3913]|uniref:chromosome partitioning protein ParA n=1 Tax=Yersinia sp. Marseille-Q3913 TaxID=2830769 RepID=UPI001BAF97BB|nr:chromosome partitioning protein ParA [Yersinia sp. Marseille-Q3913]MBS0056521.1 chromosome partitioning protein ParA [Yersinia sp. Marseille-Q3913]